MLQAQPVCNYHAPDTLKLLGGVKLLIEHLGDLTDDLNRALSKV